MAAKEKKENDKSDNQKKEREELLEELGELISQTTTRSGAISKLIQNMEDRIEKKKNNDSTKEV